MKKILGLTIAVVLVIGLVAGGTWAYFSDIETTTENRFTAGTVDISLNPSGGQDVVTVEGDLDLKPCQTGYIPVCITNDGTNPADIWKHIANVVNDENEITEPEQEYYDAHSGSDTWLMSNWIHYDLFAYRSLGYSWSGTVGQQPVDIYVEDGECQVTWTIDFPGEAPYDDPTTEGNGQWAVGLIIALDGDGNDPAYQIHNNDGTDATYPFGMWLWSPYYDGAWHSGDENTPVSEIDWISCTGDRYNEDNPDGIFTITIDKCELAGDIHWALNLAIGTGFSSSYMTYEQMSCPDGNFDWFDWGNPIVNMAIPNYEAASISTLIQVILETEGFFLSGELGVECNWIYLGVLEPGQTMCVIQSYHLDADVGNWAQSDRVFFDMEFFAQQTEGEPTPPGDELSGYSKP